MSDHLSSDYRPEPFTPRRRKGAMPEPLPLAPTESVAQPFPTHALGETLGRAARAIEETVQCPAAIAATSVLASAALAVQGHYDAQNPATGAGPSSLFAITLAESGERKSTADKLALRVVEAMQRNAQEKHARAYADYQNVVRAKEAQRAQITAANKKAGRDWRDLKTDLDKVGPDPDPPLHPNHILGDANAEGYFKLALHGPGAMLWNNAEAGQVIGGVGFSEDNRLKLSAMLSRAWDGATQDRIRHGDGVQVLIGRRLSLHFMMQPGVAAPFLSDPLLNAQGIFSRALISAPQTRIGRRLFRPAPEDLNSRLAPYEERLVELLNRVPRCGKRQNELEPEVLKLSQDAAMAWREFHDGIERQMGDGLALAEHRGFGSKLAENVARIATVLQGFNDEANGCVSVETMLSAVELGEYYLTEIQRLRALAQQTEEMRHADEVRQLLTNPDRWPDTHVSARALRQYGPQRVRSKQAADAVIRTLVEYGWLSSELEAAEVRGQRSAEARQIWGRS